MSDAKCTRSIASLVRFFINLPRSSFFGANAPSQKPSSSTTSAKASPKVKKEKKGGLMSMFNAQREANKDKKVSSYCRDLMLSWC